ncbi:hypothetical protein IGI04_022444, partial [Brassica rapa subsp. trilocularis]
KDWSVRKEFKDLILVYVATFEWDGFCLCWAGLKKIRSFSTETEKKKKLSTIRRKIGTTKLVGSSRISARSKTFSPNSTPSSPALARALVPLPLPSSVLDFVTVASSGGRMQRI